MLLLAIIFLLYIIKIRVFKKITVQRVHYTLYYVRRTYRIMEIDS